MVDRAGCCTLDVNQVIIRWSGITGKDRDAVERLGSTVVGNVGCSS